MEKQEAIKEQWMEVICKLADLEREQDDQINIVLDKRILLLKDLDAIKA